MNKMTQYNINIISDVVCPWCYIGHQRLTRAISSHQSTHPSDTFTLTYAPFYLQPPPKYDSSVPSSLFPPSVPRSEAFHERFGTQRTAQIIQYMGQLGAQEGLPFKFGGNTGSSRNGHRLIHYAKTHGGEEAQNKAMLGLWHRYFEQETDITRLDVLVDTGVEAGLGKPEDIKAYLESGKDVETVDKEAVKASMGGVNGVPHYTIQGKYEISGGQDPEVFKDIFDKIKARNEDGKTEKRPTASGETC